MAKRYINVRDKGTVISFIIVMLVCLIVMLTSSDTARADEMWSNPNEAIAEESYDNMISVTSDDVLSYQAISSWIQDQESYIFVKRSDDGTVSYYFNAPNLQKGIYNTVQDNNTGGWAGVLYTKDNGISDNSDDWTTASKEFGYIAPVAVYVGEYPCVSINLTGVVTDALTPLNGARVAFNGAIDLAGKGASWVASNIASFCSHVTGGGDVNVDLGTTNEFTAGLTVDAIRGMSYSNSDYGEYSISDATRIADWLKENWSNWTDHKDDIGITIEDKNIFDDGVILDEGESIDDIDSITLLGRLNRKAGASITIILVDLSEYNTQNGGDTFQTSGTVRYMPYELDTMSPESRKYMNNISDPRYEMFSNVGPLGLIGTTATMLSYSLVGASVMNVVSSLSKLGATLNSICDISILKNNGISLAQFWSGTLGKFILFAILVATILYIIVLIAKSLISGSVGKNGIISRAFVSTFLALVVVGLLMYPQELEDLFINTTSRIMSLGTVTIDNSNYSELYTDNATAADKSELRYWYMYFGVWTGYVTNHSVYDDANKFDINEGTNEYVGLSESQATLANDKRINLWSAILLSDLEKNDINSCYRVTDHFLAPIIKSGDYPTFTVEANPHYNGYMYSSIPFGGIFTSAAVLIITFMKTLCFIELIIDLILMMVKLVIGAFEGKSFIADTLKAVGLDLFRVIAYDVLLTIYIYASVASTSGTLLVIGVIEIASIIALIRYLLNNSSYILCPGILTSLADTVGTAYSTAYDTFSVNGSNYNKLKDIKSDSKRQRDELNSINGGDQEDNGDDSDNSSKRMRRNSRHNRKDAGKDYSDSSEDTSKSVDNERPSDISYDDSTHSDAVSVDNSTADVTDNDSTQDSDNVRADNSDSNRLHIDNKKSVDTTDNEPKSVEKRRTHNTALDQSDDNDMNIDNRSDETDITDTSEDIRHDKTNRFKRLRKRVNSQHDESSKSDSNTDDSNNDDNKLKIDNDRRDIDNE